MGERRLRWLAVAVLVLSSGLNYLDRTILSVLMPTLRQEFQLTGQDLGTLIAAFFLVYAFASPVLGLLIDRIGLKWGASAVVGLWSLIGVGTGFAGSFATLLAFRLMLGFAESGGIPVTGKGYAVYLEPQDRALGNAVGQIGITLGLMAAPVLTEFVSARYGWRSAFIVAGALGFVWIPLWLLIVSRTPPARVQSDPQRVPYGTILRDRRFLTLIAANVLAMPPYSLWLTWMTDFLVSRYGITQAEANLGFVWIPPVFATAGGLFGGWLAQRMIGRSRQVIQSRLRIAVVSSVFVLVTALVPAAPSPLLAVVFVCVTLFATLCISVNYYSIPLDLFGSDRAAFAVSFLTGAYGLMNVVLSPLIGRSLDTVGWQPVCLAVSVLPLVSTMLLRSAFRRP